MLRIGNYGVLKKNGDGIKSTHIANIKVYHVS